MSHFHFIPGKVRPEASAAPARPFRRRGAAMVEFALVFPMAIALLFALTDFARYYYMESSMSYVLRNSLRYAVTGKKTLDSTSRLNSMVLYAKSIAPPLINVIYGQPSGNSLEVFVYDQATGTYVTAKDDPANPSQRNWLPGCRIKAQLKQEVPFLTPFPKLMGLTAPDKYNMQVFTIYKMERYDL